MKRVNKVMNKAKAKLSTVNCQLSIVLLCAVAATSCGTFTDAYFRAFVMKTFDTDKDGVISTIEAAIVRDLNCEAKNIASLEGIEVFTSLTRLDCGINQLTTLDVSKNTALTELRCFSNYLTTLDVSNNRALTTLWCHANQLSTLDLSKDTALINLGCDDNQLTALDVSKNTALTTLSCANNPLTTLDVSKNTALTELRCSSNQLSTLDVSKDTALIELYCHFNQLTALDVRNNTALTELWCNDNQLTAPALNDLFNSLPTVTRNARIYIDNNPGTDACNKSIATDKGWTVILE